MMIFTGKTRVFLQSIALVAAGIAVGLFIRPPTLPRANSAFGGCVTGKQFLVEFRHGFAVNDKGLSGMSIMHRGDAFLDLDGQSLGALCDTCKPLRRFICEGNHSMRINFSGTEPEKRGQKLNHRVDFTVSRPSIYSLTERGPEESPSCVEAPWCPVALDLELSQAEPDEKISAAIDGRRD